jgi:thioredoxin
VVFGQTEANFLRSLAYLYLLLNQFNVMKYLFLPLMMAFLAACQATAQRKLDTEGFEKQLATAKDAQVLDVRTKGEFGADHLQSAMNADWNNPAEFAERTKFLDKSKPVFVYCLGGGRSAKAAEALAQQGFTQVYDLAGGMRAWKGASKPYEKGASVAKKPGMSEAEFAKLLQQEKMVLVDFGAKWCPPCKKLNPILDEVAKENAGKLKLLKLDVDENETLADAKKVTALPVLMLFKNGKLVWQNDGFADKATILAAIKKNS